VASLGSSETTPAAAEELAASVMEVVDGALEAAAEGFAAVAERVTDVVSALTEALGALLLGTDRVFDPVTNGVGQPLAFLYERATGLIERGGELMRELAQAAAGGLYSGGAAPERTGERPVAPLVAPRPVVPATPVGYSSYFGTSSWSSAEKAFQLSFAVLALFSLSLVQGGKLSRYRFEPLGPPSAAILAIERPG
jgi:hypothetical protein